MDLDCQVLQVFYKNKVETNLAHIKESSDSKLELFSTLYNSFSVPCYLNVNFSKAKRSLITKLRLSCHILNIETMRYCRPKIVTVPSVRKEHFLLNCNKYDSKRKNNRFISEIVHDFGKVIDAVKHILNPQTKQNCKSICNFIGDALHIRKCPQNK